MFILRDRLQNHLQRHQTTKNLILSSEYKQYNLYK